jgi:hypothetical protein
MSASQPQPEGLAEVDRAIERAAGAREHFDRELALLLDDLRDAREAIRDEPLPGEAGAGDESDEGGDGRGSR